MKIVAVRNQPVFLNVKHRMSQGVDGTWRLTNKRWMDYIERSGDQYDDVIKHSSVLHPNTKTGNILIPIVFHLRNVIECHTTFSFSAPANGKISDMLEENNIVAFKFNGENFTNPVLIIGEKYQITLEQLHV